MTPEQARAKAAEIRDVYPDIAAVLLQAADVVEGQVSQGEKLEDLPIKVKIAGQIDIQNGDWVEGGEIVKTIPLYDEF